MKVIFRKRAMRQLDEIYDYIRERNPSAAVAVLARIQASIRELGEFPFMAHKTDRAGILKHAVVDYPYLIFIRVDLARRIVAVVSVRHAARRHPGCQEPAFEFAR
jgi:plasmid stabilization system protein ParE